MNDKVLMLTTSSVEGRPVATYLGPISAHVVVGTGVLTDIASAFTDLFGTNSRSYESKLDGINESVMKLVAEKCRRLGGNVVLGLRVDHDEISGGGKSMLMVTATGTAARLSDPPAEPTPATKSSDFTGTQLTVEQLERHVRRNRLVAAATVVPDDLEEWGALMNSNIPELGDVICNTLNEWLRAGRDQTWGRQKITQYLASIPRQDAIALIFRQLELVDDRLFFAIQTAAVEQSLTDLGAAAKALRHDNKKIRHRARYMLEAQPQEYGEPEIAALRECAGELRTAFVPAAAEAGQAGLLGKTTEVWRCQCGNAIPVSRPRCDCTRDRRGIMPTEMEPEQLADLLLSRANALEEVLARR